MTKGGHSTIKLPPWREKPYEDEASLAFCRCREPVRERCYVGRWVCRMCARWITERGV